MPEDLAVSPDPTVTTPSSFKDLALPLIARGLYVFPTSADGKKVPLIKDWPNMASNERQHVLYWDAAFERDVNVGVVARGICILDDDRGDLADIIEKETGHKLPDTYAVRTSIKRVTGLRGMHYYFKETVESLVLGFRKKAGVYDFQCEHHLVVGAGSRHHSGMIYEEVDPKRRIMPCPAWLIEWIERTADAPKQRESAEHGDASCVCEDFDFADMCEHYGSLFTIVGTENNYHWTDPCVWSDHRHENSPKTGFYWDGSSLGWSDFVTSCEGNGKKIGETLRHLNARMVELGLEPYLKPIWPEESIDDVLANFGAEDADVMPEEVPARPNGHDESYNLKGTPCSKCQKELIAGAQDTECRTCMAKARTAVEDGRSELLLVKDKGGNTVQVVSINAASVKPEALTWTWKNRIPDASITWFVGKPGQGKSLAAVNVVATVSTGRDWADGAKNTMGPKRVLMYCPEDSISRVVVPRLIAAGADLSKIDLLDNHSFRTYCPDGTKIKRCLAMDEDIPALLTLLGRHLDIALIVCDPITGIWGDTNVNHNKEIWPVVAGLMELCEKRNLTFLGVAHTNKRGNDADAIDKIQGGSTMAGAARAAFLFSRDPDSDDKHDHVMTNVKVNYTDEWNGLKFRTVGATAVTEDKRELETVRLDWLEATEMSADDVMDKQREKKANGGSGADGKLGLAITFLTVNLQAGNDVQYKLIQLGEETEGISRATMFRAAKEMKLTSSATKPKRWFLPYKEEPQNRMPDTEVM